MTNDLIKVCYEGEAGTSDIRTGYYEDILHVSLRDIFVTLTKENRQLDERYPSKYIPNLIKSQLQDLDDDEYILVPAVDKTFGDEKEVFVTQPGLNRVMASDKSKAGKKFQRWLYHEVIPSLQKHGMYPPPAVPQGSALAQMAEIVAQNSRMLADTIIEQEKLKEEVVSVKGQVSQIHERVMKLEYGANNSGGEHILTVRQWFEKEDLYLSNDNEFDVVNWCENLSFKHSRPRQGCPSGDRMKAKFYAEIIAEAKELVDAAKRNN